jgi:hypothetical protein
LITGLVIELAGIHLVFVILMVWHLELTDGCVFVSVTGVYNHTAKWKLSVMGDLFGREFHQEVHNKFIQLFLQELHKLHYSMFTTG